MLTLTKRPKGGKANAEPFIYSIPVNSEKCNSEIRLSERDFMPDEREPLSEDAITEEKALSPFTTGLAAENGKDTREDDRLYVTTIIRNTLNSNNNNSISKARVGKVSDAAEAGRRI